MDDSLTTQLANWHDFYSAVAGIAGTLVGLLFVSASMRPQIVAGGDDTAGNPTTPGVRRWAGQTFHSFIVLLVLSLIMLVPNIDATSLGITLGVIGIQGLARIAIDLLGVRDDPVYGGAGALGRAVAPVIAYGMALYGVWLLQHSAESIFAILLVMVLLLAISAASSAWDLLGAIGSQSSS